MADRKEKIVMKSALKIISKSSSLTSRHILSYPMVSNSFMENKKFKICGKICIQRNDIQS